MPDSLIDLAGLRVGAEDFLAAVLSTAAQPIWVVDPDGVIRFANPAAIAALGYEDADELLGRRSHDTIHHSRPDGTPYPAEDCPMLLPRATGEPVSSDLEWFFRRDGSMFPVSYVSVPIEMPEGRGAVVAFTDIEDRMRAERELREHDEILAAEQASLRRVAALVAGGAASAEVLGRDRQGGRPGDRAALGRAVALRARRDRDRDRRLERTSAPVPGRDALAPRRADDLRQGSEDRPPREDRGFRRHTRDDRRRRARDRDRVVRRRPDHRRRPGLGRDVGRLDRRRAPARPHRGSACRVHGARCHRDLQYREPRGARPARGRAGGAAARRDAGRPRRPAAGGVRSGRA